MVSHSDQCLGYFVEAAVEVVIGRIAAVEHRIHEEHHVDRLLEKRVVGDARLTRVEELSIVPL